jgi:uncharacterized protein (TIGR02145 family)
MLFFLAISGELFAQTIIVGPDTTICLGGSITLNAVVAGGGYGTSSYTFLALPYSPMPFSGGVPLDTSFDHPNHCTASGHDDCWGGPFSIGFSFCFLNVDYTQFWIGSNGWISFSQPNNQWDNYMPDTLPNSSSNAPKNCIMAPWQDWFLGASGVGNNIYYYTTGTAPDRKCVIYWLNCPMYYCTSKLGTFQIVLNEQNSVIENNIQSKDSCNWQQNRGTQGVQNLTGTVAFIHPGRNNKSWKAFNESTRFVPGGITWYIGGYPNGTLVGYGPTLTVSPNNTTVYTGVVEVCGGAFSAENDTVTVMDPRFNYPGSSFCLNQSDPTPSLDMNAGIFTSSPAGLVFVNDTTGEIDLSSCLPGNYLITHTITSHCTATFSESVILYILPEAPNPVNPVVTRCGPGNVTLSVTAGIHQGVRWYYSPSGGIQYPFTGLTVTTAITSTTNFYAEAFDSLSGCCSSFRSLITAIVKLIPSIINTAVEDTICSGFNNYFLLQADLSGTTFSWTASCTLGNITGLITPNSGNIISDTLTNHLFTSGNIIYLVHASLNGCADTVYFTTHVNPKANVIFQSPSDTICSGQTTNIALLSSVPGVIFSWVAVPGSGNVSGFSDDSGNIISQTLTNTGTAIETVTYHVIPSAYGCQGQQAIIVINVYPTPSLTITPLSQNICSTATTVISLTSGVKGTIFTWTVSSSSSNLSGYSADTGEVIAQTLYNSGLTDQTVTYTVSPQVFSCPSGSSQNVIVTVDPLPSVTNSLTSYQQCSSVTTNILLQANLSETTFSWTASGSSENITGYSGGSGSVISQPLINSELNTDTATYIVTPVANTCAGNPAEFTVSVFPVPDVYITPDSESFCPGGTTSLSLSSHVACPIFTWTATSSSGNVSGFGPGSGNLIQQTLNSTDYLNETVIYAVSPSANACPGIVGYSVVSIFPSPPVNLTTCWDTVVTTDAQPIKLKGGIPLGGTYSGVGVNTGIFYPEVAGQGIFPITYSYTNTWGCTKNSSKNINVISSGVFSCGNNLTDVRDNNTYPTIQIGTQCWMASNLNFGTIIASSQMQLDNCVSEKYCYGDNSANCLSSGGLYQWDEMMKFDNIKGAQGCCPPSWHVPTEADWTILFAFYNGNAFAGSFLKFSGYSGFNAALSGIRHENVVWDFDNFAVFYWSSTSQGSDKAWAHGMNSVDPCVSIYSGLKDNAFYVRCIKD